MTSPDRPRPYTDKLWSPIVGDHPLDHYLDDAKPAMCAVPVTVSPVFRVASISVIEKINALSEHLESRRKRLETRRRYIELAQTEATLYLAQLDSFTRFAGIIAANAHVQSPFLIDRYGELVTMATPGGASVTNSTRDTNDPARYAHFASVALAAHERVFGAAASAYDLTSSERTAQLVKKILPECIPSGLDWDVHYAPIGAAYALEFTTPASSWSFLLEPEYEAEWVYDDVQDAIGDLCDRLADLTDELILTDSAERLAPIFGECPLFPTGSARGCSSLWHAVLSIADVEHTTELRYSMSTCEAGVALKSDVSPSEVGAALSKLLLSLSGNSLKLARTAYATVRKESMSFHQRVMELDIEIQETAHGELSPWAAHEERRLEAARRSQDRLGRFSIRLSDGAARHVQSNIDQLVGRVKRGQAELGALEEKIKRLKLSLRDFESASSGAKSLIERREKWLHLLVAAVGVATLVDQYSHPEYREGVVIGKALCDVAGASFQVVSILVKVRAAGVGESAKAASGVSAEALLERSKVLKDVSLYLDGVGQLCSFISGALTIVDELRDYYVDSDPIDPVKFGTASLQSAVALTSALNKLVQTRVGQNLLKSLARWVSGAVLMRTVAGAVLAGSVLNVVGYAVIVIEVSVPLWRWMVRFGRRSDRVAPVVAALLAPLSASRFNVDLAGELGVRGEVDRLLSMMPDREEGTWTVVFRESFKYLKYTNLGTRFLPIDVSGVDDALIGPVPVTVSFFGLSATFASLGASTPVESASDFCDRVRRSCGAGLVDRDRCREMLAAIGIGEDLADSLFVDSGGPPADDKARAEHQADYETSAEDAMDAEDRRAEHH